MLLSVAGNVFVICSLGSRYNGDGHTLSNTFLKHIKWNQVYVMSTGSRKVAIPSQIAILLDTNSTGLAWVMFIKKQPSFQSLNVIC